MLDEKKIFPIGGINLRLTSQIKEQTNWQNNFFGRDNLFSLDSQMQGMAKGAKLTPFRHRDKA